MSNKTTAADFDFWCSEVTHWLRAFGLYQQWELRYHHVFEKEPENRAMVSYNIEGRMASFKLYANWGDSTVSRHTLARVALHEVLHLVLAELSDMVRRRYGVTREMEDAAEHVVLRRLEDALLPTRAVGRSRRATRARPRGQS